MQECKVVPVKLNFCSNSITLACSRFDSVIFYNFLFPLSYAFFYILKYVLLVYPFFCCNCLSKYILFLEIKLKSVKSFIHFVVLIVHIIYFIWFVNRSIKFILSLSKHYLVDFKVCFIVLHSILLMTLKYCLVLTNNHPLWYILIFVDENYTKIQIFPFYYETNTSLRKYHEKRYILR